jgi:hypothetical protein
MAEKCAQKMLRESVEFLRERCTGDSKMGGQSKKH